MSLPAIDFLRPPRSPTAGWLVLALGVACAAGALWAAQQWAAERARAEQEQQAITDTRRSITQPRPAPTPTVTQLRAEQTELQLRRPWLQVLSAVESAAMEPVYLLSLSVDAGTGAVRLEAEAPSFDEAVAFVEVLTRAEVLKEVMLTSHEGLDDPAKARTYVRLAATAQWSVR
jgi:hypothetical protein